MIFSVIGCTHLSPDYKDYGAEIITRSCINLIDPSLLEVGKEITPNGSLTNDKSRQSVCSDYFSVNVGDLWYQKVIYLHACCLRDSSYGFHADVVAFYDNDRHFIALSRNIGEAVRIPEGARFARVQFRSTDKQLYAAITNRSIPSIYSPYERSLFLPDVGKKYLEVDNAEGSISHLLRTGYDYLDRGFGYGCLHTAFNSDCVESESYDDHYKGKKLQIDCSSFVELALTGVRFDNSRYQRGSESDNVTDSNSFIFDSQTEYNYYMIEFPEECGADLGRLYANKLAKYFYDRGFLYEVEEDFANVQIGDLLFWGSGEQNHRFFKGIGHVAICSDVWKKIKGGQGIRVLETASESVIEYKPEIRYGARPSLPLIESDETELVKSFSPVAEKVSLKKGEEQLVSVIALDCDLMEREVYTLVMDCTIPEGARIVCKVNKGRSVIGSDDVEEYFPSDGTIVKHFGIRKSMSGGDKDRVEVFLSAPVDISGDVLFNRISLKKGFHGDDSF